VITRLDLQASADQLDRVIGLSRAGATPDRNSKTVAFAIWPSVQRSGTGEIRCSSPGAPPCTAPAPRGGQEHPSNQLGENPVRIGGLRPTSPPRSPWPALLPAEGLTHGRIWAATADQPRRSGSGDGIAAVTRGPLIQTRCSAPSPPSSRQVEDRPGAGATGLRIRRSTPWRCTHPVHGAVHRPDIE